MILTANYTYPAIWRVNPDNDREKKFSKEYADLKPSTQRVGNAVFYLHPKRKNGKLRNKRTVIPKDTHNEGGKEASLYRHGMISVAYCERCLHTPGTTCQHGLDSCEERNLWQGYLMDQGR